MEIIIFKDSRGLERRGPGGGERGQGAVLANQYTPPQLGRATLPPRGHQSVRSIRENVKHKLHGQRK